LTATFSCGHDGVAPPSACLYRATGTLKTTKDNVRREIQAETLGKVMEQVPKTNEHVTPFDDRLGGIVTTTNLRGSK